MRFLLIFLLVLSQLILTAQDYTKLIEVIPPAPASANLGRYGGMNISLASGMVNTTIPIGQFQSRHLKIPVSLNYASAGWRVDEVAGRVGVGWNLTAGAMITRTVFGKPDERSQMLVPPAEFPRPTRRVIDEFLASADYDNSTGTDTQHDIFTFHLEDGSSGRFVIINEAAVLLDNVPVKVEVDFYSNAPWNFKITNSEGIQYLYGGPNATESTRLETVGTECGRSLYSFPPTAWYVTKITHPNNDEVNFTYGTTLARYVSGISKTIYGWSRQYPRPCNTTDPSPRPPSLFNTTCEHYIANDAVHIKEISSSVGGKIVFNYSRNRKDLPGEVLLTDIQFFKPGISSWFRKYELTIEQVPAIGTIPAGTEDEQAPYYHPFLKSVQEKEPGGSTGKIYDMEYNNITQTPPRLSNSQDHYGFYNSGNSGEMIPPVPYPEWNKYLTYNPGNRNPDDTKAQVGMLKKITYPTGGSEEISYEGNRVYDEVTIIPQIKMAYVRAYSETRGGSVSEHVDFEEKAGGQYKITGGCSFEGEEDNNHQQAFYRIYSLPGNQEVFFRRVRVAEPLDDYVSLVPGKYRFEVEVTGPKCSGGGSLEYREEAIRYEYQNILTGGVRVNQIIAIAHDKKKEIRKFNYNRPETENSSGSALYKPIYDKILKIYLPCPPVSSLPNCLRTYYDYYTMYSNTQNSLYQFSGPSPISYNYVREDIGENGENGGILHKFIVAPDYHGELYGENILGAPLVSNSWKNGKEEYQLVFKKVNGLSVKVKETFSNYKEDHRFDLSVQSYVINKKYKPVCQSNPPDQEEIEAYDYLIYENPRRWYYLQSVINRTYNDAGDQYIEEITLSEYADVRFPLVTKTTSNKSDNSNKINLLFYPFNSSLTGNAETARALLKSKNILSPVLKNEEYKNTIAPASLIRSTTIEYDLFSGLVLPKTFKIKNGQFPEEKMLEVSKYDEWGHINEQALSNNVTESVLWGYSNLYPVAKITGAKYTEAKALINQGTLDNPLSEPVLRTELAKLRTGLPAAQVVTYTFDPLIGATTITDPKGDITYYEYDLFGRLGHIRDKDRNILKKYEYAYRQYTQFLSAVKTQDFTRNNCPAGYAGSVVSFTLPLGAFASKISQADADQQANAAFNALGQAYANTNGICLRIYFSIAKSGNFIRNNCSECFIGSTVAYTVPAGKYTSLVNQDLADALAQNELTINGQAYANANGTCTKPVVYARISSENQVIDGSDRKADIVIRFYSDINFTVPFSVTNMKINYTEKQVFCDLSAPTVTDHQVTANGTEIRFNAVTDHDIGDGVHCWQKQFALAAANCYFHRVFSSDAQSQIFRKNNCTSGRKGVPVTYSVPLGKYKSVISLEDANAQALNEINTQGQSYANTNGSCAYFSIAKNQSFTRNNCAPNQTGSIVNYAVPADKYTSTISQLDADNKAQTEINANGQAYANANGLCNNPSWPYAKLRLSNYQNEGSNTTATLTISFYSDIARTIPVSVSNLRVDYRETENQCGGASYDNDNYTVCNGTSISFQVTTRWDLGDGEHCWNRSYTLLAGTGYYINY